MIDIVPDVRRRMSGPGSIPSRLEDGSAEGAVYSDVPDVARMSRFCPDDSDESRHIYGQVGYLPFFFQVLGGYYVCRIHIPASFFKEFVQRLMGCGVR